MAVAAGAPRLAAAYFPSLSFQRAISRFEGSPSSTAFRACAVALLGSDEVDEAIEGADNFARCLRDAGQVLSPGTAFMGAGLVTPARNLC